MTQLHLPIGKQPPQHPLALESVCLRITADVKTVFIGEVTQMSKKSVDELGNPTSDFKSLGRER